MLFEEINQLLKPGYLPVETGYCLLPNGHICIALLTRMPGCKGKWLDLFFNTNQTSTICEKGLIKNDLIVNRDLKYKLMKYVNEIFFSKNILEEKLLNVKVVRENIFEIFDPVALIKSGVTMAFFARSYMPDGTPEGLIVHVARDTNYGCEMRTRFWLFNDTEETARIRLEHYISEHGILADSIKKFIEGFQKLSSKNIVNCKFCASSNVVKNGFRQGNQNWLCKECGRGFVDNMCLPKMKYPFNIVGKAVYDYQCGKSLKIIRKDINEKYQLYPSNSTILGWIQKLTRSAIEGNKIIPIQRTKNSFKNT